MVPTTTNGLRICDWTSWINALARHDAGRPIVPGNSRHSEVQLRISSTDPDVVMPPPETGQRLTQDEVRTITRWIDEGAHWGKHWSFVTPVRPRPETVRDRDWPTNAIDTFVLARLDAAGLAPTPRADRETLIRRVTFALTGLPPTPTEAAAFLKDPRADAYHRLVDRLLHSPRFGEHMARQWLDVARYGDTHGLHLDNERSIWRYRDWVIEACNGNLPFDQFTVEQLAGDLLPQATVEQRVATGFHRCNVTTSEGGCDCRGIPGAVRRGIAWKPLLPFGWGLRPVVLPVMTTSLTPYRNESFTSCSPTSTI